jgi:phosphoserine phosphatase
MLVNNSLILINVSGKDQPGITSTLMKAIIKGQHSIKDMGQSVTHGLLSLSILIDVSNSSDQSSLLKDLLFEAKKMNLTLDFQAVEQISNGQSHIQKHIISSAAREEIPPKFIAQMSEKLAIHNINIWRIDNVDPTQFCSLDISTTSSLNVDWKQVKAELIKIAGENKVDIAILKDNVFRRNKRLIVFDMDSTLIQAEVIDELAKRHGVGEKVHSITERAMNGELNFDQSLKERVRLLKGLSTNVMSDILENLPLTDGVPEFINTVKRLGYKTAIISGGFNYFAQGLKNKLGIDFAFANDLEIENGKLTGELKGTIVNAEQKAFLLDFLSQQESIMLEQVVAIGDGANDLPMLAKAGMGVAFHAKAIVRERAQHQMSYGPMTSILYFLGIPGAFEKNV